MARDKTRLAGLILAAVIVVLVVAGGRNAHAQPRRPALGDDDVAVLTPPVVPPIPSPPADVQKPADLTPFLDQTIIAVDVIVDEARWPDVRPPTITKMHAGDRVSRSIARQAMEEALLSGYFADARVTYEHEDGGVRATVHVMPRRVIESVRIDLHGAPVETDELLRDADVRSGNELIARDVPLIKARLEALLRRRGFPNPTASLDTKPTDDPMRVVVTLDIDPGPPRKIERRVFYRFGGSPAEAELAEKGYTQKSGMRADENALDTADNDLQNKIRARGFHRAEVSHDVVLHRGLVALRVRVDFGTHYETRYEGNDHYDKATLDEALELDSENDRTPNHLVQKLREFYVKHGFLDAEIGMEERGTAQDPVHYIVFKVMEEDRVNVAGRSYPCLREDDVKRLTDGPASAKAIGSEIDSYLEEELPGNDLFVPPRVPGVDDTIVSANTERGTHPAPLDLDPDSVYAPETYERAIAHVQELYRAEGFLSAQVGPVQVARRQCDPRSPAGSCVPMKIPAPSDVCTYDAAGMPLPVPPLETGSTCIPDPAHGITCEPRVWLRIPVKLGPRTQLWDVAFDGAQTIAPAALAKVAKLDLGGYVSTVKIEEARRRVTDAYKEEGYAYVDVKYAVEPSPDRTRARVRFTIAEGEQVIVRKILIQGNLHTNTSAIAKRVALEVGKPYRASDVRKTEERIATLGAFASVSVALENPFVPQRNKTVIITVIEQQRQYVEPSVGFSTGEGFRVGAEYGHRNLWGNAVQLTTRLQVAYIPTPLILDSVARDNYRDLTTIARIGVRTTAGMVFPEIGLGPLVRTGIDGIFVHDLQRDFYLTKLALIPNINFRPVNELQFTFFQSFELNNSRIFQEGGITQYIRSLAATNPALARDVGRQLLVPDGETYVFSQRLLVSWDRRDSAFDASSGTYVSTGIEHVDGFPIDETNEGATIDTQVAKQSHFFKLTQTFGGYIPIIRIGRQEGGQFRGIRLAALTRFGVNLQITSNSSTYPDRLFFLGGVDSMRGWNLNSFIPQDNVDLIFATKDLPDRVPSTGDKTQISSLPNGEKVTPSTRPINGGNLMINQRIEIRIPIKYPVETGIFTDIGNLWIDPTYPFTYFREHGVLPMRVDVGTGIRLQTPVGPLAFDYGINLTREPYEDFGAFNFSIGLF